MLKEHEDKIREDERDLQKLNMQIEKIEKLTKEYSQQKQEIGSLKNIIHGLKNQNEQLRSRSLINQKQSSIERKNQVDSSSQGQIQNRKKKKKNAKSQTWKSEFRNNGKIVDQTADPEDFRTKPKLWNLQGQRSIKYNSKGYQPNQNKHEKTQLDLPQPSLRNHSGYISTGRLLSPQNRMHFKTMNGNFKTYQNNAHFKFDDEFDNDFHAETNYFSTKNRLIDNLVADLRFQLEQKQSQLANQYNSHKATKKMLKKTLSQNEQLSELNTRLFSNNELMQKQNQFLKQELIKQTESKHKFQSINQDFVLWHNTIVKRSYEQFQLEFMAMDGIYSQFQRICSRMQIPY